MLRTKTDVDRHVAEILRKVKSEREKNLKCYNIALLYYKVRDYESAKLYVSMYLLAKEDAPLANKLLGQIYEALGQKERALAAYKTSLEYESNQPELVLKMCELMCETDVTLDVDRARYWCERGSEFFPHDPAIFRLKERLLMMGGKANSQEFEQLINAELKARPSDVNVHIRLSKLYMETNRVKAAYNHAVELESRQTFRNELTWYECFAQVCETYFDQNRADVGWEFYLHWVSVLDRAARLTLVEGHGASPKSIADCVQAVFNLDQALYKATSGSTSKETNSVAELYKEFLKHMSAELYLHMATLTLKKAKNDHSNWKEASQSVSPLLFLAMCKPVDMEATWTLGLKANLKKYLQVYRDDAYYRVSQAGYVLLGLAKETGNQFTEKVKLKTSSNWRERLFQRIFSTRDQRGAMSTSHLVDNPLAEKLVIKLPVHNAPPLNPLALVPVFEKVHAKSLHYLVWLGVEILRYNNYKLPPDFHTYSFTTLQVSGNKIGSVSADSLNRLDLDAFLYLTVFCANAILDEEILNGYHSSERPLTLPADISNMLCTIEQSKWWASACGVYSQNFKNNSDFVEVRQTLQQGLGVLRMVGNHGLDVQLIVKLARTFSERANHEQTENSMQVALEGRANLYWTTAIPLLEKIQRNQLIHSPVRSLFKCPMKDLSAAEISSLLEEGRYFIACQLMKEEENERAIEAFKSLRSPHASFNQALIYKKLANAEYDSRNPEDITSEIRSKHIILLTKARECLYTTKERIRLDKRNPLHAPLAQLFEEIESALVRIEPDFVQRRDDAMASDASISSVGSPVGEGPLALPLNTSRQNGRLPHGLNTSTPQRAHGHGDFRRQINPPEYVEVGQLLQIQTLVDQNKKVMEKIDNLSEQLQQVSSKVDLLCEDVRKLKPPGPEDLYIFGEEEDYGEDVLGQYPTNFPAPYQPPAAPQYYPTRGVQGTSTLTYGAPPTPQFYPPRVEPALAFQAPVLPAPIGAPPLSYYNQNALPFSEGQQLPDFLRTPVLPKQPVPPVNVVITTSDTLPTGPPPIQPPMSVTIPPQHRLGTIPAPVVVPSPSQQVQPTPTPSTPPVHNFQISMPASANIPSVEKSPILGQEEFESDDESNVCVERDPYPDFQPIIPLPDEVAVCTGEEGETVLFENRAKLYRHVDKEWKERGVGVLKILKNVSSGTIRILMRRDQVLKICANHLLKSDMELTPLKNSNVAYIWVANDFADETVQLEKLCAKFKTPEEALKFRDAFNEAKKTCGTSPLKPKKESQPTEKSESSKTGEAGKMNFGGFTFSTAWTVKSPEKANVEEKKKETVTAPSPFASFSFTPQKSGTATPATTGTEQDKLKFGGLLRQPLLSVPQTTPVSSPTEGIQMQPKSILKDSVLQSETPVKTQPFNSVLTGSSPNDKSQQKHVLFQDAKPETASNKISESKSPSLKELLTSTTDITANVLDFAALSKMNDNVPAFASGSGGKKQFEGAGSTVFGRQKRDSEGEASEDFIPTAEFKPVIPLPELVEVKTGEEDQEVLFDERSKLFRFDSNTKEWKERGVGKMKILKDSNTGAVRFLMRREQVLKLCCNHRISSNLDIKSHLGSDRAWTWHAQDYSEGEMKNELFAIRFKNSDQAKAFKQTVDQVLEDLQNTSVQSVTSPSTPTSSTASPANVWKCPPCLFPNSIDSSVCRACKTPKPRTDATSPKLSEWMRPKPTRWECINCYTVNEPKDYECGTCGQRKSSPKSPQPVPLSEMASLKQKSGSWDCEDCYLNNDPKVAFCSACGAKKPGSQEETSTQSLADMFKPKAGSWNCTSCYVSNEESAKSCLACQTTKPGVENPKEAIKPLSEMYKPKPGSWSCPACYVPNNSTDESCVACQHTKPGAVKPKTDEASKSLADMFKPKAGSWECSGCLVRNDGDKTSCPACNTPKPGHQPKDDEKPSGFSFGGGSFTFGVPADSPKSGFNFEKSTSAEGFGTISSEKSGFGLGKPTENTSFSFGLPPMEKIGGGFSFGAVNDAKKGEKQPFSFGNAATDTQSSGFKFSQSGGDSQSGAPAFSFGTTKTSSLFGSVDVEKQNAASFHFGSAGAEKQEKLTGDQFSFGTPGKFDFTFGGVRGPRSPKSPAERASESEPDEVEEDDGDHIHFQPVVPLPDKVDVKTGEEDEEVLYSHRSKLYRYINGEWKERGIGDIKILRNFTTKKIRLLMRREPIMKLCLNHYLTPELSFSPKDNRAWLWSAIDYAEEELKPEQFCLRFKTPEIAAEFKEAIDSAQKDQQTGDNIFVSSPATADKDTPPTSTERTSVVKSLFGEPTTKAEEPEEDVEVLYENDVTAEEREAAIKLQLPPKFYAYRRAPPCPGCVGCEADDEDEVVNISTNNQADKQVGVMYEVCTEPAPTPPGASVIVISKSTTETNSPATADSTFGSSLFGSSLSNNQTSKFDFGTTSTENKHWFGNSLGSTTLDTNSAPMKSQSIFGSMSGSAITHTTESPQSKSVYDGTIGSAKSDTENESPKVIFGGSSGDTQESQSLFGGTPVSDGESKSQPVFGAKLSQSLFGGTPVFPRESKSHHGFGANESKSLFGGTPVFLKEYKIQPVFGANESQSLFGGTPVFPREPKSHPLFGGTESPSLFGGTPVAASESKTTSLFGGTPVAASESKTTSLFGGTPVAASESKTTSLFGGTPVAASESKTTSLFGGTPVAASESKTPSLFGGTPIGASESKTPSLFGGTPIGASESKTPSLFGGTPVAASESKTTSLFGGTPVAASESKTPSLFGGTPIGASESKTPSLFGGTPVAASESKTPSLFGATPIGASELKTPSLFGGTPTGASESKIPSLFGKDASETAKPSIFGTIPGATPNNTPKSQSFFGSSSFTKSENSNESPKSIFGGTSSAVKSGVASEPQKAQFSFGSTPNQFTFGSVGDPIKSQFSFATALNNSETKPQSVFGSAGSGRPSLFGTNSSPFNAEGEASFAQLAAEVTPSGFQTSKDNFTWAGEGTPIFTKTTATPTKTGDEESSGDEGDPEQSHDPQFEPIVPLPAAIQVRTGEEDEIREFCHRAKLYRFNNATKEWKERGVGEMKILRHPVNHTYRLLMRREQVYKVVCNHLLTELIEIKLMANTDTSLTWVAMNLSDETDTPQLELLAIKFKTTDLCLQFKTKVDDCIQRVVEFKQANEASSPQVVSSSSKADSTVEDDDVEGEEEEDYEGNDLDDNDDYYDEDDEDEVFELLFEKPATLYTRVEDDSGWATIGSGELQILYDRDLLASRIYMKDCGDADIFDSVISGDSHLTVDGKDCTWIAEKGAQVMARFHSESAAEEFKMNFFEGVNFAEKALI